MRIRGAQWNIQAARVLEQDSDPTESSNYKGDDPAYFASILAQYQPDFVTLQEIHSNEERDQAREIADILEMPYCQTYSYENKSFMNNAYSLGQSVLSHLEFTDYEYVPIEYEKFNFPSPLNPNDEWRSRENGLTIATLKAQGVELKIATTHLIPFGWLKLDPWGKVGSAAQVRSNLAQQLKLLDTPWILQGDLNVDTDSIASFVGNETAFSKLGAMEHPQPTNPDGQMLDHILTSGADILHSEVITTVRADHYLLITDYELHN